MDLIRRNLMIEPHLTIAATDLTCPEAREGERPLLRDAAIEYSAELHDRIPASRLFWGPYLTLRPGVYLFKFDGRVEGELTVDFAHRAGNVRLKQEALTDFSRPVCLVVTQPAVDLEVRGLKTKALRSLRIEAIAMHRAYIPPKDDAINW